MTPRGCNCPKLHHIDLSDEERLETGQTPPLCKRPCHVHERFLVPLKEVGSKLHITRLDASETRAPATTCCYSHLRRARQRLHHLAKDTGHLSSGCQGEGDRCWGPSLRGSHCIRTPFSFKATGSFPEKHDS